MTAGTFGFILLALLVVVLVGAVAFHSRKLTVARDRARYIQGYVFPPELRNRLQRNHDMSLGASARVLEGLRQYFLACLSAQRSPIARQVGMPSKAVDAAWHEFIVLTKEYARFCDKAFGRYLHHTPDAMMAEPAESALANTLHQFRSPALSPAGWAMVGSMPLLFALDRELGFKGGYVYDDKAIQDLEVRRELQRTSSAASGSGGDSGGPAAGGASCGVGAGSGCGDGGGGGCGGGGGGCGSS